MSLDPYPFSRGFRPYPVGKNFAPHNKQPLSVNKYDFVNVKLKRLHFQHHHAVLECLISFESCFPASPHQRQIFEFHPQAYQLPFHLRLMPIGILFHCTKLCEYCVFGLKQKKNKLASLFNFLTSKT